MKKQWLSIVLVLCMVLCLTPTTARAEESKTGTLKITVDISGVYEGDNVGDKTFSFEILRKYANYGHYKDVNITIEPGKTEGTVDVPVEEGKYVVKQTSHATIDGYPAAYRDGGCALTAQAAGTPYSTVFFTKR